MHAQSVAAYTAQLGEGHVRGLRSNFYLALTRLELGQPGTRIAFESAAAALSATLSPGHPALVQLATAKRAVEQRSGHHSPLKSSSFRLIDL